MSSISYSPGASGGGSQDLQSVLTNGNIADLGLSLIRGNRSFRITFNSNDTFVGLTRQTGSSVSINTTELTAVRSQQWADDDGVMMLKHFGTFNQIATGAIILLFTIPHGLGFRPEIVFVSFDNAFCSNMVGSYALSTDATNIYITPTPAGITFDFDLVGKFLAIK